MERGLRPSLLCLISITKVVAMIAATIAAINVLLGTLIGVKAVNYKARHSAEEK